MKQSSKHYPPRLARVFFKWSSSSADVEDLLGDMDEYFQVNVADKGVLKAQIVYFKQVISLSFSFALRKRKTAAAYSNYYTTNSLAMIRNYFKIAFRNFSKHKLFTSINILGLAMGMSICLLALAVSVSIYQSDEFHEKKNRIYQINTFIGDESEHKIYASTFNAVGDYMSDKYPFIESVVKIKTGFEPEVEHSGNLIKFRGYFADASFFEVFDFPLISGDARSALAEPFSIVLTRSVAEVLFRDEDPLGEILETELGTYHVTGVMEDVKQTHFNFKVLTSYQTYVALQPTVDLKSDWRNYRNNYVYLLLKPDTRESTLTASLAQATGRASEFNVEQTIQLESVVLSDVVPRWNVSNAIGIGWDQPSMIFFMFLGVLILLPAVFNYTNLSMARALKRAKEIGIRKVVGAAKSQIKAQFVVETVLLTFLALVGSLFMYFQLREEFLDMVVSAEVLDISVNFSLVVAFVLFTLLVGLLAGIFPALYFSRMNPVQTLKGDRMSKSGKVSGIKKGLFVFQFALSMVFLIGVGAIARQYAYVFNHNHGFESENVLAVPFKGIDKQVAVNELKGHPDVKSITTASHLPGVFLPMRVDITPNGQDTIYTKQVFIGDDFMANFNIKMAWGQSADLAKSTKNEELVLVNEQFMRSMSVFNVPKDSLAFTIADGTHCRIAGVFEDFNVEPLSELITPVVFRHSLEKSNYALLTISSPDITQTMADLDAIWSGVDQKVRFEATFLDDEIEEAYYFLEAQIKIFSYLSAFAITISCLGLLGMVSFTTENRTKEIAIRKIMGATSGGLYYLLTKDFLKLIMIAAFIAIPFSYLFYEKLFLHFVMPNGNGLGVLEIILSVFFLFMAGFVTIYWQTLKVANANPADNLRYE